MHLTTLLSHSVFFLLAQAEGAPPPAEAAPPAAVMPDPAPAPAPEMAPAPAMPPTTEAAPAPGPVAAPGNPRHWRLSKVEVPGSGGARLEVRVLRADETAVSLGEGLADVGDTKKLQDRAARLDDSQTGWQAILGRVVVLGVGGSLTVAGLLAAGLGAGFWAWSSGGLPDSLPAQVSSIVVSGPSILLTGLIAAAIGLFTVVTTAALWAWFMLRGPPPADPAVVQALGAALAWEEKEALDVVRRHNERMDTEDRGAAAGMQPPVAETPAPAPAP